jgi:putative RecB family exonuclease
MEVTASIIPERPQSNDLFALSVSKIKTFQDCKAKYKYSYIEKLPRKEWDHFVFGKFLHEVLETFHKSLIQNPDLDLSSLMTERFKAASENYKDKIKQDQKQEAHNILKNYLSSLYENEIKRILSVEREFYIDIDGKILLNGFIDRVELDSDGIIHVADYKTTKNKKYMKDFFQLLTYAFVLMLEDSSLEKVRASFIMLRHDFEYITKEFTRKDVMVVAEKYLKYADEIHEEKIFRPNPTMLCAYCDFSDICQGGKAFLKKKGLLKTSSYGLNKW